MARYIGRKRHRRLAGHLYSLEQFGLTEAEVEAAIGPTRFVR
jgi:hypothetical protein